MSTATVPRVTCCTTVAPTSRTRGVTLNLPCRVGDPDLWFAESPTQLEEAKALCATCPIRKGCLAAALDRQEPWGVWGGEIFDQGVVIARKRPRGRPRKVAVA
ncbi:WhiB family redox-sensing transcriptional regulator [Nocardia transvalensis]|uniref:Transcriptional regulator WhiB n=1 Tax=Nocardia transvalensis TaxID=37333 RepID=A0A7W9PA39_9NOCA|nr:WhiB family redox-sensing transcriptional regulator [Nocardia transvalensis]